MNPLDRLGNYLKEVERRLRLRAWTRGAAVTAAAALVFTVVLVLIANQFAFSSESLLFSRTALFLALAFALGAGLLLPLLRLNAKQAARRAEQKFPQFEERLLTFAERAKDDKSDPFLELLAADAMEKASGAEPSLVATRRSIAGLLSVAIGAALVLLWLGTSGPGFWGYGTSMLWAGPPKGVATPFYDVTVEPGNRTVRKRADQIILARLMGFTSQRVRLLVKYDSASKWEEAEMRPQESGTAYEFLLSGVPESLEYYVEAGGVRSKHYKLNVVDLPAVKKIKVTYHFPAWTGLKDEVEDPGGDLRAVEGTVAEVAVQTDRPLANGVVILDDSTRIPLQDGVARVPVQKDGLYHLASIERAVDQALGQTEEVRLSDDYFIEARKDQPPNVRIRRPGHDAKVNPIEEVPVLVEADDDFGLHDVKLVYSVNGGPEKTLNLLTTKGAKTVEGKTLLSLEDFKLVPGDVVSIYATAKDARKTSSTDIFFIEAEPFEREFSQSQQAGGMGGGEQQQNQISQRQKEIIAATWNQIKDPKQDKAQAAENAKFLADVQSKLRDQARSLAQRMKSRELSGTNQEFQKFAKDMEAAVEAMGPAIDKLRAMQWQPSLPDQQKALQNLMRAESTFRQIQVAFGSRGGGGGGSGRDLQSLFDLELDTEKNQYESGQQASADQRKKEIDEALQKLEELAKRQQELADQQRKNQQTFQQRWQQEMLRREAEQLERKVEQLTRSGSQSQQGQQSQSSQGSQSSSSSSQGQQSSQSASSGRQSGQPQSAQQMMERLRQQAQRGMASGQQQFPSGGQQQLEQALERLKQATRDMQNATSGQGDAEARRAAERLQEARNLLSGLRSQQASDQLSQLAQRSEKLAGEQQDFANRLRKEYGGQAGQQGAEGRVTREKAGQLAAEREATLRELQQLEKDLQAAARDLQSSDRSSSGQIRRALAEMQQNELTRNMQWSAEAIRQGFGSYAVMREALTTQALNDLRDRMRQIAGSSGAKANSQNQEKSLEQALAQAESLRRQMEQLTKGRGQQEGGQGQQGRRSEQGQQPGEQGGQGQSGQQGKGGQQGAQAGQRGGPQQGGQAAGPGARSYGYGGNREAGPYFRGGIEAGGYDGRNYGERYPLPPGGWDQVSIDRIYRDTIRDLGRLRENLQQEDPETARDVQDLIRDMQRTDPRRLGVTGGPELSQRINAQFVTQLEQIELQLRRKLEEQQGGSVRSGAGEPVPAGYANSIAEYFRRLSKGK